MKSSIFLKLLLPVSLLSVALFSCNPSRTTWQKEGIAKVDSLLKELDTLDTRFAAANSPKNKETLERMEYMHERLGEGYADSAKKDFWVGPMNDLFVMLESYEKFMEEAGTKKKSLAYTRRQLESLRRSITDKKVTEMETRRFLNREMQAVQDLTQWMNRRATPLQDARSRWDTTRIQYERLLEKLPVDSSSET